MPHVHVGAIEFLIFLLMLVPAEFALHWLAVRFHDRPIGQALNVVS